MNELLRFEPTPDALRNGRRTVVIVAIVLAFAILMILFVPGFSDNQYLGITAGLVVTLLGDSIAYLGAPTKTRYRAGLAITTVGILIGLWFFLFNQFPG